MAEQRHILSFASDRRLWIALAAAVIASVILAYLFSPTVAGNLHTASATGEVLLAQMWAWLASPVTVARGAWCLAMLASGSLALIVGGIYWSRYQQGITAQRLAGPSGKRAAIVDVDARAVTQWSADEENMMRWLARFYRSDTSHKIDDVAPQLRLTSVAAASVLRKLEDRGWVSSYMGYINLTGEGCDVAHDLVWDRGLSPR
jgi:hypothetical protein